SSATVTLDTDSAVSSLVYYGQTSDYGATSSYNAAQDNSHSVTLTGLSAATSYHFQVAGSDGQGTFAYSGDSTFVTAAAPVVPVSPPGGPTSGANAPGVSIKAVPTEKIPPTISLTTNLSKPYGNPPKITGFASDNDAVALIEYSIDGGKNWQPVSTVSRVNKRNARDMSFEFTPTLVDDGNYIIMARATDASSNTATTAPATLVLDRLPPQVGPIVVAYGPHALQPDAGGVLNLVAGSDYRVTTSAVGGPTGLSFEARHATDAPTAPPTASFALAQSSGSGLWRGVLSFKAGGAYQLVARAVDGAGNHTARVIA